MTVEFLASQIGAPANDGPPLPYTSSPFSLLWADILLFFVHTSGLIHILVPVGVARDHSAKELNELYPTRENLKELGIHTFLIFFQLAFLISIPVCLFVMLQPIWFFAYVIGIIFLNRAVCKTLNGAERFVESRTDIKLKSEHESERWVLINGVSVGRHWLQSNVDRLSLTFGRKVTGVHNPTFGIVFDVLQCLLQRCFCYATQDARDAHACIKEYLENDKLKKVVLIAHSQGGIIGSLVVDWLLDEVPRDALHKLEVYTFASAANHFNNPYRHLETAQAAGVHHKPGPESKAIRYIEHYANSQDFVSRWGVLNFARVHNRYMGRVFERPGSGHMLNQHLLDTMFPLGPDKRALDESEFMEMKIAPGRDGGPRQDIESSVNDSSGSSLVHDVNSPISPSDNVIRVKDVSRLWLYRNGDSPLDAK